MSNTASVPTFSVFASLREPSATLAAAEFFTLRREGAKRSTSNDRISVPNLSGFAPLRETSVTQGGRAEEER